MLYSSQQLSLQVVTQSSRQVVQVSRWQTHPGTGSWLHPVAGAHASVVQAFWSSQKPLVSVCAQTPSAHESAVHALSSSQLMKDPAQLPAVHASPLVQAFPSSQAVPSDRAGFEQTPV